MTKEEKLQRIIEMEKLLDSIQDVDVLLERVLTEARVIVRADAGSIYVVEENNLKIKYAQNDTELHGLTQGEKLPYTFFSFPINEKSISGYVAYSGQSLNIEDVYEIPAEMPYKFNTTPDKTKNYRSKSMYVLPLKNAAGKVLGVLQMINARDEDGNVISFDSDAELYINHFASSAAQALEHAYITSNMVRRMLKMAEFRDPKETYAHAERVSNFALEIYDRWAFNHNVPVAESHRFRDALKIAAKFHDVGKVGVSDIILKKTYPRFTPEERSIMQGHTCIGGNLFEPVESFLDQMSRDVALHHHEHWDGSESSYPGDVDYISYKIGEPLPEHKNISGEQIPLSARIVSVADVFDALSHKRCYKEAWSIEEAFNEIQAGAGTQFDPEVVLAFMQIKERISAIQLAYPDSE